ncbi:MAG TPA: cytochrome c3 family protein [Deltaproteobacteria bacterium]|nr:cytochrome c3 family protein [Deltaproteobacteria bacterium]
MTANLRIPAQRTIAFSAVLGLILSLILFIPGNSSAVTGLCVNCHTMHNSQDGGNMATYGGGTGPNPVLLRGTCLGCHAYNKTGTLNVIDIGGSQIPQVWHDAATDLAAGNFKYVDGTGYGKGHNVIDFFGTNSDVDLDAAPGVYMVHDSFLTDTYLTCAGTNGCHGSRQDASGTGLGAIKGAHHGNVDGKCNTADTVANSYRFLLGTKGLENTTDKWQNKDANSHNEYYGRTTPTTYDCGSNQCHASYPAKPLNGTITDFCGTCHPNFHGTGNIGGDINSPFTRHPTDIVLKGSGEFAAYTTYSVEAPVGRTTVPDAASGTVVPGTDVITCLSCHAAHGTNYPDMLKWDYLTMNAGGGGSGGCFTCHTEKDNP